MPYAADHSAETRRRIVESARHLFNRRGFTEVSIDEIMAGAGLTRGGFYHHFKTKDELYAEAISFALTCNPVERITGRPSCPDQSRDGLMRGLIQAYLSREHLSATDEHCALFALPSDVARASVTVREAYQNVLLAMARLFERGLGNDDEDARRKSLALAAICVGGMTLASTVADNRLAEDIRKAALDTAMELLPGTPAAIRTAAE
ncbi:MAG: TetR/AcrR family transcriptional regulator [Hyphomicrobiaceae bacterium]